MRYDQPVGSQTERDAAQAWAGEWFDASGFGSASATYKTLTGSWHTGADLNLPNWKDSRAQVFASADGVVVFVGTASGWQGRLIVIKHEGGIWTRYAHLAETRVVAGQTVKRGDWLAVIGDYLPAGPANDHLHFDVARIDLGAKPADWPGVDKSRLERDYVDPREWINSHREDDMPITKWTPTSADGTRVRLSPDTSSTANIAGVIPPASIVDGELSVDGKWLQVQIVPERMTVSGVQLVPSVAATFAGYAASQYMKPAPEPPPTPPTPTPQPAGVTFARHLGVSVLIDAQAGMDALARGCRAVLFLNNNMAAVQAAQKYSDAITFMRTWWGTKLTPAQMASALDGTSTNIPRNCYTTILNECDTWCYGSPDEIRERFNTERQTAEIIWSADPNRVVCIGQFSHGTPDITRADIREAWRQTYGQFAIENKARIRTGWHLYTKGRRFLSHPPSDAPIIAPEWFEGRDDAFWRQCNMPQDVRCICDEMGVEAGAGGFRWAGYSAQQFIEWAWWWLDYNAAKFVRHDAMTIFQYGDHPGWQGYDCRNLVETLTGLWQGKVARPVMPRSLSIYDSTPPPYEVPPAKQM